MLCKDFLWLLVGIFGLLLLYEVLDFLLDARFLSSTLLPFLSGSHYYNRIVGKRVPSLSRGQSDTYTLMDKILHDPKDPKLWELWYIPYNG